MAATDEPSIVPRGVLPMRLCEVCVKPPPLFTHEKGEPWPEESPDDLQINHQIRVEAHLVA